MFDTIRISSLLFYLAHLVVGAITITTTKNGSNIRFIAFGIIVSLVYLAILTAPLLSSTNGGQYAGTIASQAFLSTVHIANLLLINGISSKDLYSNQSTNGSVTSLVRAFLLTFNTRGIGTRWQTKNVPSFPRFYSKSDAPQRGIFLVRQASFCIWMYLVIDLVEFLTLPYLTKQRNGLLKPGAEFTYINATTEQWTMRFVLVFIICFLIGRFFLDLMYRLASIVLVACWIFSPSDFPPLFGSVWDAYTIRNFWGKFWHQMLRWPYTSLSGFITQRVLGLPKPSLLERYTNVFLVWTTSGLHHVIHELASGDETYLATMTFYQSFAIGTMIEDAAQEMYRRLAGTKKDKVSKVQPWKKFLGFLWVLTFTSIVGPWVLYPKLRGSYEQRQVSPYSITEKLGVHAVGSAAILGAAILRVVFGAEP